jgi:two-component system phosphate regulon sensor histidine kinase PhoR
MPAYGVQFRHVVTSRISVKLVLIVVAFVAIAIVAGGAYLNRTFEGLAEDALEARLVTAGRFLHDEARDLIGGAASSAALYDFAVRASRPARSRVTLVAPDGTVLADSAVPPAELGSLENHAARPEVRGALAAEVGRDLRTSTTVHERFLYVGLPVTDAGRVTAVLRLALPLSVVTATHAAIHRALLIGALVALAVAVAAAVATARHITRPVEEMERAAERMSEGDFTARAPTGSVDEIGRLGRALNIMAMRLRSKIEDLEDERRKAATILDAMVEGVVAVDGHDIVLLLNQPGRAMLGLSTEIAIGKPLLEVIRHTELHAIVRATRAATETPPVRREMRLGKPRTRLVQVTAMPLPLGADTGVVMVLDDVTELRRLEQVRTEFLANVSHELRTPLTAIQGYVETLLTGDENDTEQRRHFLDIVHRHTERLGRLLGDLTDLSNIELGRVTLALGPTSLADVVGSVLAVMRSRADARRVALDDQVPHELPFVNADHDRLQQILINLVDNAVKYTPEGGRVTVAAVSSGSAVEMRVIDTGIGIPAAHLPRITERFYRVDRARSRELGGTGLGLAIVKHLVHAHGGSLVIDSEPERGTTVRFTLSVARPTA